MRVLILSITAGEGHNNTGKAVLEQLKRLGADAEMIDAYEHVTPLLKEAVSRGYLMSTSTIPKAFGTFYNLAVNRRSTEDRVSLMEFYNKALSYSSDFTHYLEGYKPDVIVCTHVFAAGIVDTLKKRGKLSAICIGIVTDFTLHPFWEDLSEVDYFVMASELLSYGAEKRGIAPEKILPFGIPIHPKFSADLSQAEAKAQLGLKEELKTILIMSGSMGFGKMDKVIKDIDTLRLPFQAMVVCGNNTAMYEKINEMEKHRPFSVYGFVNNVDVMMSAADLIVTKPGGLTSSEALAKGLPMIMVNPIPGQEERNVDFLLNTGLALYATDTMPVDELAFMALSDEGRLPQIRESIARLGKRHSTERLCEFILSMEGKA